MSELKFTAAASAHLQAYLSELENAVGVRFSVKKSGCSGFKYVSEVITEITEDDVLVLEQPACYVTKDSMPALLGMTVDYKVDKFGSSLVYINPNAKDICGCGESFRIIEDD